MHPRPCRVPSQRTPQLRFRHECRELGSKNSNDKDHEVKPKQRIINCNMKGINRTRNADKEALRSSMTEMESEETVKMGRICLSLKIDYSVFDNWPDDTENLEALRKTRPLPTEILMEIFSWCRPEVLVECLKDCRVCKTIPRDYFEELLKRRTKNQKGWTDARRELLTKAIDWERSTDLSLLCWEKQMENLLCHGEEMMKKDVDDYEKWVQRETNKPGRRDTKHLDELFFQVRAEMLNDIKENDERRILKRGEDIQFWCSRLPRPIPAEILQDLGIYEDLRKGSGPLTKFQFISSLPKLLEQHAEREELVRKIKGSQSQCITLHTDHYESYVDPFIEINGRRYVQTRICHYFPSKKLQLKTAYKLPLEYKDVAAHWLAEESIVMQGGEYLGVSGGSASGWSISRRSSSKWSSSRRSSSGRSSSGRSISSEWPSSGKCDSGSFSGRSSPGGSNCENRIRSTPKWQPMIYAYFSRQENGMEDRGEE
ncbi:hypothetical protein RUND412_001746 [Rhizina undulata]